MSAQTTVAYLVADGSGNPSHFDLTEGAAWKIGRSDENQIVVVDETVSRVHIERLNCQTRR